MIREEIISRLKHLFAGPLTFLVYGLVAIGLLKFLIYLDLIENYKAALQIDINSVVIALVTVVLLALAAYLWFNRSVLNAALTQAIVGPLRILLYGLTLFIVIILFSKTNILSGLAFNPPVTFSSNLVIAVLVFLVGIAFAAFLWWLCFRYFELMKNSNASADQIAALKDMPMALPEGTVRAVIALIVGIVGLPILIFSSELHLSDAIAGYVNGIVIGVFSYYFGSRSTSADAQTAKQSMRMLDSAQSENKSLQNQVSSLAQTVDTTKSEVNASQLQKEASRLEQQVSAAQVLLEELGPALPKGLIPDSAGTFLGKAKDVLALIKSVDKSGLNADTLQQAAQAAEGLIGASPVTTLLQKAAGILPAIGGLTPVTSLALLVGVGWRLGSEQYRRWVARVLNAPYDPKLIDIGRVTSTSAQIALANSPIFSKAFPPDVQTPAFITDLVDMVLSNDAGERLWKKFGNDAERFSGEGELLAGLDEFREQLLGDVSTMDITDSHIATVLGALQPNSALPLPKADDLNQAIAQIGANIKGVDENQRSAFEALIMLTGKLREVKMDPAQIIAELKL